MSTNGFRDDELITRRVKVGNEWQTRTFPVVGGRLRLAHEGNGKLSLQTKLVTWNGDFAVFKCVAVTEKGQFVGYGTANSQRDSRLAESLIELAETRSIARALRFAGFGLEVCGAEEVSHVADGEAGPPSSQGNDDGVLASTGQNCPTVKGSRTYLSGMSGLSEAFYLIELLIISGRQAVRSWVLGPVERLRNLVVSNKKTSINTDN